MQLRGCQTGQAARKPIWKRSRSQLQSENKSQQREAVKCRQRGQDNRSYLTEQIQHRVTALRLKLAAVGSAGSGEGSASALASAAEFITVPRPGKQTKQHQDNTTK